MCFSPFCNRYLCDVFACLLFQASAKMRKGRQGCGLVGKNDIEKIKKMKCGENREFFVSF